jgi:hypothetical protein
MDLNLWRRAWHNRKGPPALDKHSTPSMRIGLSLADSFKVEQEIYPQSF